MPESQTLFIVNFQLGVQNDEELGRLNFSRDMISRLEKNLIFFTTSHGDDRLARKAYDFYSFIKIRILFDANKENEKEKEEPYLEEEELEKYDGESGKEAKEKLQEINSLLEEARRKQEEAQYDKSEKLLLIARQNLAELLGEEHLEIISIDRGLAMVYERQKKYEKAEKIYKKALLMREHILGKEHPDTAQSYHDLAVLYMELGQDRTAEMLFREASSKKEKILLILS